MFLTHALRAISRGIAVVTDPFFKYVSMLLPGTGTNGAQNNTFVDSSTNNFAVTRVGNTTQGTFTPYGSNWSNYFDGSGDYLGLPANVNLTLSGDFTIEFWINLTALTASQTVFNNSNGNDRSVQLDGTGANWVYWDGTANRTIGTPALNIWTHIALTRQTSTVKGFLNGVQGFSVSDSGTIDFSSGAVGYRQRTPAGASINGHISNFRIVKGTAVYTANFTPSTTPLTAITNTSLLTCQSNRFIDNSTNNFTITKNGDVSVQRFSPYSPAAAYSTSTIGGSAYFDGTGDYLTTPATGQFAPTGDFTISFWYYPTVLVNYGTPIGNYTANTSNDWLIESWADGTLKFYAAGGSPSVASAAGALKLGQWHYISMSRSGTTITGYINGVSQGTSTLSGTFGSASKLISIGALPNGTAPITGYISDVKLLNGFAITSVPTAPQTVTTGTSLLLNFTNGGIIDNAMMNDLETVGNAQISTAQSKFGGSSMYFDGTGDYLSTPSSPQYSFGTGDFTIEFWMYSNNVSGVSQLGMFQMSDTAGGIKASLLNQMGIYQGATAPSGTALSGSIIASINNTFVGATTAVLTTSTWYHIALVRSSGTVNLYVNGTSVGSASITSAINGPYIGIGGFYSTSFLFNGYIDDLRVTKGYARYTANFTPPTAALPTS